MIRFEKQGHIGILTVSRPEALNALNSEALDGLLSTVQKIADDISVRALIVTGEGKAFVAGADIAEMKDLDADAGRGFGLRGQAALSAVEALPMPVIAAVNGYALGGGCELALCADIRIASEKARFGQPEVGILIVELLSTHSSIKTGLTRHLLIHRGGINCQFIKQILR
jgi:enoyl-CoA hydratase